jgi:citrate synthase
MHEYVPGLDGVPATKSAISDLDGEQGILSYRGYRIEDLAENCSFEETTYLLMHGQLPTELQLAKFDRRAARRVKYNVREIMKFMPNNGHPMEMLQTSVASLGMFYPESRQYVGGSVEDEDYLDQMALKIIARMGTLVAMWESMRKGHYPHEPREDLNYAANFLWMMSGEEPDPLFAEIMDACLVLHAEHTINASTFSAMVTGSTLAQPSMVAAAAIGTLAGPLHGAANQRVVEMLKQIGSPEKVPAFVEESLEKKRVIWGMGHREYSVKDPRATILEKYIPKILESKGGEVNPLFLTAQALEKYCEQRLGPKGVFPNVDFYSGILYTEMGIPLDQFTPIFAIYRSAGWMAHWRQQIRQNRIFRPTQIYVGSEPRKVVPMAQRG